MCFSKYLSHLFENELYAQSTIISHQTSIVSVLTTQALEIQSSYRPTHQSTTSQCSVGQTIWPVQQKLVPHWDLILILAILLRPPFMHGASNRPGHDHDVISLKWWTLKTTFLLLLPLPGDHICTHFMSTCFIARGDVQDQLVVNLLLQAGSLQKNQMSNQAFQWICIRDITHLNPNEPLRMLCPARQLQQYLRDTKRSSCFTGIHWSMVSWGGKGGLCPSQQRVWPWCQSSPGMG